MYCFVQCIYKTLIERFDIHDCDGLRVMEIMNEDLIENYLDVLFVKKMTNSAMFFF